MTNCSVQVSKCNEIALVDQLDGFDLDPNLKIKFSGPIDVSKVNGTNLYLERVCSCRVARMPLVRLVWDPSTNTLYGHPKHQLRESSTYHVTVTSGINGQSGTATFTTMSATVGLRQMQAQLDDGSAYTAAGDVTKSLVHQRPLPRLRIASPLLPRRLRRQRGLGPTARAPSTRRPTSAWSGVSTTRAAGRSSNRWYSTPPSRRRVRMRSAPSSHLRGSTPIARSLRPRPEPVPRRSPVSRRWGSRSSFRPASSPRAGGPSPSSAPVSPGRSTTCSSRATRT